MSFISVSAGRLHSNKNNRQIKKTPILYSTQSKNYFSWKIL